MQLTHRDKRMLQILGVVAGLALIYLLFTTVLAGDDGGEVAAPNGPTGGGPAPTETPSATPSPTPRETLPPVVLAGARDPFAIPPELQTATPGGGVSPTGTATTTPPATETTTPPTDATTPPATETTTPPTTTTAPPPPPDRIEIGGHDVRLVSIFHNKKKAQVEVDGVVYTVEVGATFNDNFKLVEIEGKCSRFLFGDQRFTLCFKTRK